jgi:hydroxymethylpyrimidine/phosphomethylpyrimidine kinase
MHLGRVLIIAGSDSGGGAGVQADIKTVTVLGGYATTAITAITAQNTRGVFGVERVSPAMVRSQIAVVLDDIGTDVIKIGMLGDAEIVHIVADALAAISAPIVLDPVMIAKGGRSLLAPEAVSALRDRLVPMAALVTPNAPEAEALAGAPVGDLDGQRRAAAALLRHGARAALIKGGHIDGSTVKDVLVWADGEQVFESPRIDTHNTHGTGCTLASAIAVRLGLGDALPDAVVAARHYLMEAIRAAPGLGGGHGPVDHNWPLRRR